MGVVTSILCYNNLQKFVSIIFSRRYIVVVFCFYFNDLIEIKTTQLLAVCARRPYFLNSPHKKKKYKNIKMEHSGEDLFFIWSEKTRAPDETLLGAIDFEDHCDL